ncbi:MAG: hypothetical protein JO152_04035 [Mycobacteriaceae bacterium]|nr:hypothetical protein [Mycobacteriaceae bacterium]
MAIAARQLIAAGALSFAFAVAPWVAAAGGTGGTVGTLAGPSVCTVNQSGSSSSIVCLPGSSAGGGMTGAPSQQEITEKNAQRGRDGLGL